MEGVRGSSFGEMLSVFNFYLSTLSNYEPLKHGAGIRGNHALRFLQSVGGL